MMSAKLIAEMYALQQKGAKDRTPKDRYRLEQLRLKKSADDAHQKEVELQARIGKDFLRNVANQSNADDWLNTVVSADDHWYAEMLVNTYREEAEKKAADKAENDDKNQDQSSSETAAGVQQDQA